MDEVEEGRKEGGDAVTVPEDGKGWMSCVFMAQTTH